MSARLRARRWFAALIGGAAIAALSACSGEVNSAETAMLNGDETLIGRLPVLEDYDAFVIAGPKPDLQMTDVYGLRLDPYRLDRITRNKRVSGIAPGEGLLVVTSADEGADRLGIVNRGWRTGAARSIMAAVTGMVAR